LNAADGGYLLLRHVAPYTKQSKQRSNVVDNALTKL